jgi:hypothetical protein
MPLAWVIADVSFSELKPGRRDGGGGGTYEVNGLRTALGVGGSLALRSSHSRMACPPPTTTVTGCAKRRAWGWLTSMIFNVGAPLY